MLSQNMQEVGWRNAGRIWGFMSKFVMLDRLSKALGAAKVYPGLSVPRKTCSSEYLGTGAKVRFFFPTCLKLLKQLQILEDLNPPTKLLGRFLRSWGEWEKTRAQFSQKASILPSMDGQDPASVALNVSRRLIAIFKVKNILNIKAALEMMALAIAICSEV